MSSHSRSKTDPGQGSEIKAIIEKTVEDIKELNQVDFTKIYSRPKRFPKPFPPQKSQSTHTSPRASPTSCSPCVVDDAAASSSLNRNRSRSLKILTDILKSGRGGVDYRINSIPKDVTEEGKSISDSQLVPRKPSLVKEEDGERRSSSDGQLETNSGSKATAVSNSSSGQDSGTADSEKTNTSTPEVPSPCDDARDIKSPVRKKDFPNFRRAKSEVRKITLSDDEGVGESDQETPHTASYKPYHTIDTNSKFLALWKIGTPKRRTGFAGFVQSLSKTDDMSRGGDQPYLGPRKLHRVELKPIPTSRKVSSRHVTHPPNSKSTFREEGAIDTNGFGTITKSDNMDSEPSLSGELDLKTSELSLADSQLGASVSGDEPTFHDVVEIIMKEGHDLDKPVEKRNGKTLKTKSKSDPCGEKSRETVDLPKVISSAHSSPLLSKSSEDENEGDTETSGRKEDSTLETSDQKLCRTESHDQEPSTPLSLESADASSQSEGGGDGTKVSVRFLSFYPDEISGSSTPSSQSPTNVLEVERPPSHLRSAITVQQEDDRPQCQLCQCAVPGEEDVGGEG